MSDVPLRVVHLPRSDAPTSYVTLMSEAVRSHGVVPVPYGGSLWRLGRSRGADVVHLHWLEFIAPSDGRPVTGFARTLIRYARLLAALGWIRLRGISLVWTVHNLAPHEPVRPRLERNLGRIVMRLADTVVAHSEYAKSRIAEQWGVPTAVTVIPHPNYIGVFAGGSRSRHEIRSTFKIPQDAFTFLAFGQVRPYKRLPELVEAFSTLAGDDVRLVIAGKPVVADDRAAHASGGRGPSGHASPSGGSRRGGGRPSPGR